MVVPKKLAIYRKRYIPAETIHLADDELLLHEEKLLVTKWTTLKPRKDFARGISAYVTSKGYKVSKLFDDDGNFVHWYCDIIRTIRIPYSNKITFEDLLLDVKIYGDGRTEVLDLGELLDADEAGIISHAIFLESLRKLDTLLSDIYSGKINEVFDLIKSFE